MIPNTAHKIWWMGVVVFVKLAIGGCAVESQWVAPVGVSDYQQMMDWSECAQAIRRERCMNGLGYVQRPYYDVPGVGRPGHAVTMTSRGER